MTGYGLGRNLDWSQIGEHEEGDLANERGPSVERMVHKRDLLSCRVCKWRTKEGEHLYPTWFYYPRWQSPPSWVSDVLQVFAEKQRDLDTREIRQWSNTALRVIGPGLTDSGFDVETSKAKPNKLYRPVLFGENGQVDLKYEIDAYHPGLRVALEIEAIRAVQGNAVYRDLVQLSLLVDVDYAVLAVPLESEYTTHGKIRIVPSYQRCNDILGAIYNGRRLRLPFEGFLLVGY